jgi:glycosyltransferase involved in cell wall biosynthesis
MSALTKIDVFIPVYNDVQHVGRAIQSCLDQTGVDVRILVSDNCSTDGTFEKVKDLANEDSRIILMQNAENIGMIANVNRLFELVERPHYIFLCSDDHLIDEAAFAKAIALMETDPQIVSVYSDIQFQDGAGLPIMNNRFRRGAVFDPEKTFIASLVSTRNRFGIPVLHKRETGLTFRYQANVTYASDVLHSFMTARGRKCGHLPYLAIGNTYSGGNLTRGLMRKALHDFHQAELTSGLRLSPSQRLIQSLNFWIVFAQKLIFFRIVVRWRQRKTTHARG